MKSEQSKTKAGKRVRVLLTDGRKTKDLMWLQHTSTDVHFGAPDLAGHWSYHASGVFHFRREGQKGGASKRPQRVPLADVKGYHHMMTFGLVAGLLDQAQRVDYKGGKADVFLFLHTRTLPPEPLATNVMIGLLEPGRLDAVRVIPGELFHTSQIQIVTSVSPWVVLSVGWAAVPSPGGAP